MAPLARPAGWVVACAWLAATAPALAQGGLRFAPSASLGQTITDNRLDGDSDGSEAITSLGLGLRATSFTGRVQGSVDYALTGLLYARDSSSNELQNRLQARVRGEVVERHFFVDLSGTISQQAISALGQRAPDEQTSSGNRTEVRTFSVRPSLQGTVAGAVDVLAGVSVSATDSGTASASDSTNAQADLHLSSVNTGARLGWTADASRQIVDFDDGRRTEVDRAILGLSALVHPDVRIFVRGGAEANDFTTAEKQQYDNYGAGLHWTPSPRTRMLLDADRRSFGHSHGVTLEHRSRRTVWRYSDRQDINDGSNQAEAFISAADFFSDYLQSLNPGQPVTDQELDELLTDFGLDRESVIRQNFLVSSVTLQRSQELSMAVDGLRTSFVVRALATSNRRVDDLSPVGDDLADGNRIRQHGFSATVSHRLTPTASLSLQGDMMRTRESGTASERTELRSVSAYWRDQLSPRTSMSLGVRHSDFDSETDPYTENAVIANLRLAF